MSQTETPLVDIEDLGTALRAMTILPAPEPQESARGLLSVWAWPLIGLGIALIAALIGLVLSKIGMGAGLAAIGVMAALAALTGCRHEAGLLRAMTSLFGRKTPSKSDRSDADETEAAAAPEVQAAQNLAPAVMALTFVTLARWSAITALVATGHALAPILAGAMLSRAAMPLIAVALPPADGAHGDRKSVV